MSVVGSGVFLIVMGVSGSGKSTVGMALATKLSWPFVDGDALHSAANIAKMAAGHPLTDADRAEWLAAIRRQMDAWAAANVDGVLACSALHRSYRDELRRGPGEMRLVFLDVAPDVLAARLAHRHGHFMPPALLPSQLATLQRPTEDENPITVRVSGDEPVADVVAEIVAHLK
jgi:gluconokinase